ncbi:DUF4132 domain-containing protein [Glycomyces rhizosphaerae]|uniref:DUF4132 domain-containing protein n=1 Tax=Glycomyces rhizosphaerae TaxID=2054422 RepID=A0ABV7Q4Z5_9ACTN
MTDHVAPQEDQLEIPAAWSAKLLPWRGRRDGKPVELADPEWLGRWQRGIAKRERQLRAALAMPGNAPFAAAAEAYLEGKPDPRGAAAIATLILDYGGRADASRLRPEFDCWLYEHGLAFATAAAVERLAVDPATDGYFGGQAIAKRTVTEHQVEHPDTHELTYGGIAAVRSILAAASDEEYAEVVAAVAGHRDTGPKRIAAMLLLPTEPAWVLEACTDYGKAKHWSSGEWAILLAASRAEHLAAAGVTEIEDYIGNVETVVVLLGGLGTGALPVLLETEKIRHYYNDGFRKQLYRAIALMPSDEATAFVFERLDLPNVWESATEAAARFPVRVLRVAARLAPAANADVRLWLTAVVNLVDRELHVHLSDADRAVLADLLAGDGRVPEACPADLPPLLVTPPWTRKRPKAKPVVIEGLEPPAESHVAWTEAEKDRWHGQSLYYRDEQLWDGDLETKLDDYELAAAVAYAPPEQAEAILARWNGEADADYPYNLLRILARYGERVIDRVLKVPAANHRCQALPGPILNLAAARIAAERLERLKSARTSAIEWFERHGLAAVPFLVPDALGSDKRLRRYAEFALAHLASRHGKEAITAAAAEYGTEAAEAITALLEVDPLVPRVKVPKLGNWITPLILPQVLLKGGERALPAEAIPHLITVLALGTPDYAYPGIAVVAEACDRDSLARFSRALFDRWTAIGAPAKDAWALTQLIHFADDATVWALAPLIREWPGESLHKRAVTGLEVLGAIGTEEDLRAIQTIADKVKFNALQREAGRQIERVAEELGLSREQLADRLVPDFGLGEAGALVFDYGPRTFTVAFDEQLRPLVTDDTGKPRKSLPKPGAKDDPDLAEEAYQRFAALKKELRGVAVDQVRRIETAMVSGRDWSVEEFRRCFAEHALTRHLTRRLVWLAEVEGDRFGFRIAEDGTFGDVEDEAVDLPETGRIRVAHPVQLGSEAAAWAEVFADYEILQPFDQLNRPVLAFTEDELATGRLTRFEGVQVDVGRILGMTNRGWFRAAPENGGVEPGIAHRLPGGGFVTVTLDPGIYVGDVSEHPVQTITRVRLRTDASFDKYYADESGFTVATDIDPVTASEILASLARLTGTA